MTTELVNEIRARIAELEPQSEALYQEYIKAKAIYEAAAKPHEAIGMRWSRISHEIDTLKLMLSTAPKEPLPF